MSKIKCFHCHKFGHYATKFPHKKSTKKPLGGETGEALTSQFELYFTIIVCMAKNFTGIVWYLDFDASFHMTGCKELFISLEEKDLQKHIEMGDNGRYSATGIGIVTFEREKSSPLRLKSVMFIPRLKKNLIPVAILEDHGYASIFSKGKSFLRHITTKKVKQIGV